MSMNSTTNAMPVLLSVPAVVLLLFALHARVLMVRHIIYQAIAASSSAEQPNTVKFPPSPAAVVPLAVVLASAVESANVTLAFSMSPIVRIII